MRRVFILFISFLVCLCCLDIVFGCLARPLLINEPDAGNNHSNLKQSLFNKDADLLVLGASKSNHHYITDSLHRYFNLSVCNTGIDGDNIVTSYVIFNSMLERHKPKMVIVDLSGGQMAGDWEVVFLSHKCYYGIHPIYTKIAHDNLQFKERVKLYCSLYRLNEEIPDIIQSYIVGDTNNCGFIPLKGSAPNLSHIIKGVDEEEYKIGTVQEEFLNQIVDSCKSNGIDFYVVYSPTLISYENKIAPAFGDFCDEKKIPYFNYEGDTVFVNHPELFKDYNHLNLEGAKKFTTDVIGKILSKKVSSIK